MGKPIKFSTTKLAGSLKKGSLLIGVDKDSYDTTWYNSVNSNGYHVVYEPVSGGSPRMYVPQNASELIRLAVDKGGISVSTEADALEWLVGNGYVIGGNFNHIVTDGLVLNLNASEVSSYPKRGNIWYDLSGNDKNGTLINGTSFNPNGFLVFDASNDRVTTSQGDLGDNASYSVSLKSYGRANAYNMYMGQYLPYMGVYEGDRIVYSDRINNVQTWFTTASGTITTNKLHNIVCTRVYNGSTGTDMKIYIDGVESASIFSVGRKTTFNAPDTITVGDGAAFTWYPFYGEIVSAQVYNKALTNQEILRNFIGEENFEIDGDYLKVFRHYSGTGDFFSNNNSWEQAKRSNPENPQANKYSILDRVSDFLIDDKYTFKLNYPQLGVTNIWSQTNNPVTGNGSGGVNGYVGISIGLSSNGWGGLERYDVQTSTFLDGTLTPQSNWYYAVGVKDYFGGATTFPGPNSAVNTVELWVKYK
jgi:hypothetical protein